MLVESENRVSILVNCPEDRALDKAGVAVEGLCHSCSID